MPQRSYTAFGWQDDDDVHDASASPANAALAGLPASWHSYDWWMAAIAFSVIWIVDSWMTSDSLLSLVTGCAGLALTLVVCCGAHRLCSSYSVRLAQGVCILMAVGILIWHAFY